MAVGMEGNGSDRLGVNRCLPEFSDPKTSLQSSREM